MCVCVTSNTRDTRDTRAHKLTHSLTKAHGPHRRTSQPSKQYRYCTGQATTDAVSTSSREPPFPSHIRNVSSLSFHTGFRIGGCQGMIGQPKFWYGGMLQQAAAGRFLGYGGMRQPGVRESVISQIDSDPGARERKRSSAAMDLDRKQRGAPLVAYITTHHESHAYHGTRFQHSTPRRPVLGRGTAYQDDLVGVCSPAFRIRNSYHLW